MTLSPNEIEIIKKNILEKAKRKYTAPVFVDKENCRIDNLAQYQEIDTSKVKRLSFSSNYSEQLPVLPKFDHLESLSFFCGITPDQLNALDLNGVKKLYAVVLSNIDCTISFQSETLEELSLSFRKETVSVHVDFGLIPNLEHLCIRNVEEFFPRNLDGLSQLESITISANRFVDIPNIETLRSLNVLNLSYPVIDDFDGISFPPALKVLNISYSEINNVKNIERLALLEYLNIYRTTGDILTRYDDIRKLDIERLVITEEDKFKDYYYDGVATNDAVWRASSVVKKLKDRDAHLHPYTRKRYAGKTDEEIFREEFFFWLNVSVKNAFYNCNPRAHLFTEYNISFKKWFVEKMEEVYPFLDFSDFRSQIETEEKGFMFCSDTVKPEGFNFLSADGLFRVCFRRREGKGLDVRMLSMHDFMDKKRNHMSMWSYAYGNIKKAVQKYIPEFDFDSQKVDIVFLDYYGTQNRTKLEIAVVIAIALLHYGVRVPKDILFSGQLTTKAEIRKWSGPSNQLILGMDFNSLVLFSTQKNVPPINKGLAVEMFRDFQSFIDAYSKDKSEQKSTTV